MLWTLAFLLAAADGGVTSPLLLPPPPAAATATQGSVYQLRRWDRGWRYFGRSFDAQVAPDGSVKFHDHQGALGLLLSFQMYEPLPAGTPTIEGSVRKWLGRRRAAPRPPRGGVELCDHRDPCFFDPLTVLVSVGASFDINDAVMRGAGQDPYRHEKERFLAVTSEFRAGLARAAQARALTRAQAQLPDALDRIWRESRWTAAQRRRLLYALWIETADDAPGASARASIERFIRTRLPRGSQDAFTDAELTRLAASSPRPFRPYSP